MGALVDTLIQQYGSMEAVPDEVLSGLVQRRESSRPESTGEALFGEMGERPELMDIARAVANIPQSGGRLVGDIFSAVTNPVDTAKALGSVGYGGILKGAQALTGNQEGGEEYKAAFEHFIDAMSERYGGLENIRQTAVRDPVGMLLDVSPLKIGAAKMASRIPVASKVLGKGAIRPFSAAGAVAEKGAGLMAGAAQEGGAFAANLTTGMPAETFRVGIEAAAKQPLRKMRPWRKLDTDPMGNPLTELDAFRTMMREDQSVGRVEQIYNKAVKEVRDEMSESFGTMKGGTFDEAAGRMRGGLADLPFDDAAKSEMLTNLQDYLKNTWNVVSNDQGKLIPRTASTSMTDKNLKVVQRAYDQFRTFLKDERDLSLWDLHNAAVNFKDAFPNARNKFGQSVKALTEMQNEIRGYLKKQSPEFAEESAKYARTMELLDNAKSIFSESSPNPSTRVGKLFQLMRETPQSDLARETVEKLLRDRTGMFLAESAAGSALSQWIPSGIHARAIALGAGFIDPLAILALPFTMPRVVGELTSVLGMPAKYGRKTQEFVSKLRQRAPADLFDSGASIGTVVNRMLEEGEEPPPFPDFDTKPADIIMGR